MACSYCVDDQILNIPEAGDCALCKRTACAYPNGRHDNEVHGHTCECRCGEFICHVHFSKHSRSHKGGTPARCFPTPTVLQSAKTLAIVEKQVGPNLDTVLPIAERDTVSDFVLHYASTREAVQRGFARMNDWPIGDISDEDLHEGIHKLLASPLRLLLVTPAAFNSLAAAWSRLKIRNNISLPDAYLKLGPRIAAMSDALLDFRASPLSGAAIEAYAELSPRIATALRALAEHPSRRPFSYFRSLGAHLLFTNAFPDPTDALDAALSDAAQVQGTLQELMPALVA